MIASSAICLLVFCALSATRVDAFFDGFDFFKQFNQGMSHVQDRTHAHTDHLEHQLRTAFAEPLNDDVELFGSDSDDVEYAEQPDHRDADEGIPGFVRQPHHPFQGGFFNMFGGVRPIAGAGAARQGPWWKGENVCVEREEIDESKQRNDTDSDGSDDIGGMFGSFEFSNCRQTETRYTCTTKIRSHGIKKTFVVKYQCCHGYMRVPGKPGCTQVDLKNLTQTIIDVGAKDFIQLIKTSNLEDKLANENLTLFVPTDDALRNFMDKMQQENQVEFFVPPANSRKRRSTEDLTMKEITLGHMTPGFLDISELVNEQILYSEAETENSTLRINIYPTLKERMVTCNCAKLTNVNNYATNGIVHVVDRVIQPATKTLAQLIETDERLKTLQSLLVKSEMLEMLSEPGHMTLFAPTEEAFKKLPASTMSRLQEGKSCLEKVLKHHLLSFTMCSAAVSDQTNTYNLGGNVLSMHLSPEGKVFVEDIQIVVKDVLGSNGIIHIIDTVIVPNSAKSVSEILTQNNFTSFVSLLRDANLIDTLDAMNNITVFAPTDKALAKMDQSRLEQVKADPEKLKDILLYHTTTPEKQSCDLANDLMLQSRMDKDSQIRINLYASQPLFMGVRHRATAQCARLIDVDNEACGGVIHAIDRLMVPPNSSVLQLIDTEPRFSVLKSIIKDSGLEQQLTEMTPITFLAPTNEAFDDVDEATMKRLTENKEMAKKILKQHILPEALCCTGVMASSWPFTNRVETLSGESVAVQRDPDGDVHIGTTTVTECDVMAINGIVHAVNRIMMPRNRNGVSNRRRGGHDRNGNPNVEVFLYGL